MAKVRRSTPAMTRKAWIIEPVAIQELIDVEQKWSTASSRAHELEQQLIGLGQVPVSPRPGLPQKVVPRTGALRWAPPNEFPITQPVEGYSAGSSASAAPIRSAPLMSSARAIFNTAASVGMCSPRSIFPT